MSRGYAKPILDSFEPTAEDLEKHKKIGKKLMKGGDITQGEIGDVKKQIEGALNDDEEMDDSDDSELNEPIFTSEVAKLKHGDQKKKKIA